LEGLDHRRASAPSRRPLDEREPSGDRRQAPNDVSRPVRASIVCNPDNYVAALRENALDERLHVVSLVVGGNDDEYPWSPHDLLSDASVTAHFHRESHCHTADSAHRFHSVFDSEFRGSMPSRNLVLATSSTGVHTSHPDFSRRSLG